MTGDLGSKIIEVSGKALPMRGNDIDTDRILPARYLKEITFSRMGEFPFYDERFDEAGNLKAHPFNDSRYRGASVLFVNKNFGCGSSREHAPQALYRFGIKAIVGESFAAIFAGNCLVMGIPTATVNAEEMEQLLRRAETDPEALFNIDLKEKTVSSGDGNSFSSNMPETFRKALMEGFWDSASILRANSEKVKRVARRLLYMTGFRA